MRTKKQTEKKGQSKTVSDDDDDDDDNDYDEKLLQNINTSQVRIY